MFIFQDFRCFRLGIFFQSIFDVNSLSYVEYETGNMYIYPSFINPSPHLNLSKVVFEIDFLVNGVIVYPLSTMTINVTEGFKLRV